MSHHHVRENNIARSHPWDTATSSQSNKSIKCSPYDSPHSRDDRFVFGPSKLTEMDDDEEKLFFILQAGRASTVLGDGWRWVELRALVGPPIQKRYENENDQFKLLPETYTIPEPGDIVQGNVVTITRYEPWTAPLYIRTHVVDQFVNVTSFVNDATKEQLYVTGAPGCGKTCFFWMWASMLMKQNRRVLFVQYRKNKKCAIYILDDGTIRRWIVPALRLAGAVFDVLQKQSRPYDVCILDGVRTNDSKCEDVIGELDGQTHPTEGKICKLVLITSFQFTVTDGDEPGGTIDPISHMSFDSWHEDDYIKAAASAMMQDPVLRDRLLGDWTRLITEIGATEDDLHGRDEAYQHLSDEEKISQAVLLKYNLAGGSARYMFQWNVDALLETLSRACGKVKDWSPFTEPTSVAMSTSNATVNSLTQRYSCGASFLCVPMSKYVLLCAYETCHTNLTNAIHAVAKATNHAFLKDWAFELKQKDIIYAALFANRNRSFFHINAVTNSKVSFTPKSNATFDGRAIVGGKVETGTVIWCCPTVNQGLLDAAFYFDKTLVTLQFTTREVSSRKQKLLMDGIRLLRNCIAKEGVKVDRVVHLAVADGSSCPGQWTFDDAPDKARVSMSIKTAVAIEVDHSGALKQQKCFMLVAPSNSVQPVTTTFVL